MIAVLFLGVGGSDISKLLSMMGLNGGLSFERNFSRNAPAIMEPIREECAMIIEGAFKNEIIATLKSKEWSDSDSEINELIKQVKQNTIENLPASFLPIPLTISYDMGWQRRACGRVYDSLSGHGFFVGCLTGKVIRVGVLQKNAAS
jgi:hypothetical protein